MMNSSVLKDQQFKLPLAELGSMRPKAKKGVRQVVSEVSLTSLVDVFTILVVYLLVSTTPGSETLDLDKNINLPAAKHGEFYKSAPVVKILNGEYFLDEQPINIAELPSRLAALNRENPPKASEVPGEDARPELIVQADKTTDFSQINPVITSSSHVGFFKIKFAVLNEGN
jgi:biopolymer transport protein ExbD